MVASVRELGCERLRSARQLPGIRQQLGHQGLGMGREPVQRTAQVSEGIEAVTTGAFDNAVGDGDPFARRRYRVVPIVAILQPRDGDMP